MTPPVEWKGRDAPHRSGRFHAKRWGLTGFRSTPPNGYNQTRAWGVPRVAPW